MKKTISTKVVSAILVCMLMLSVVTIASAAGNIQDTSWRFDFTQSPVHYTENRDKLTTNKIYFKRLDQSNYTFTARAYGVESNSTTRKPCYISPTTGQQYSFIIRANSEPYYITNWVRENGYLKACVQGTSYNPFVATGVWSPDNSKGK